jgi:hypothetical protein
VCQAQPGKIREYRVDRLRAFLPILRARVVRQRRNEGCQGHSAFGGGQFVEDRARESVEQVGAARFVIEHHKFVTPFTPGQSRSWDPTPAQLWARDLGH